MPTSRRYCSRRTSSRKSYLWQTASIDPTNVAAGANLGVEILPNVFGETLARSTIERIIGSWSMRAGASDLNCGVAAGIYLLTEEARVAGALLEPEVDLTGYLWTDQIVTRDGDITLSGRQYVNREVNSKARRRMQSPENNLMISLENIFATAVDVTFFLRILLSIGK